MEQRLKVEKQAFKLCIAYVNATADQKENAAQFLNMDDFEDDWADPEGERSAVPDPSASLEAFTSAVHATPVKKAAGKDGGGGV